jgi:hypothetical protein
MSNLEYSNAQVFFRGFAIDYLRIVSCIFPTGMKPNLFERLYRNGTPCYFCITR